MESRRRRGDAARRIVAASRAAHGLPPTVTDVEVLKRVADLLEVGAQPTVCVVTAPRTRQRPAGQPGAVHKRRPHGNVTADATAGARRHGGPETAGNGLDQ